MIKAVIFDMDGVIIDSERIGVGVLSDAAREQGFDMPQEFVRQHVMGTTWEYAAEIYKSTFPGIDPLKMNHYFMAEMARRAQEGLIPLRPDVRKMLDKLDRRHIKHALASSSYHEEVSLYLNANHIYDRFDQIISGEMCTKSKPNPDIFLLAAEKLEASPENCLVIEDSPNGVRAGRAAGMIVCMIPDQIPYTDDLEPYCDYVLPGMNEAMELI